MRSILFIFIAFASLDAFAIDCAKARTLPERTICSSPALRAYDQYLNQAYETVRAATAPTVFAEVQRSQREWIRRRDDTCGASASCMVMMTQERTAQLNAFAQRVLGGAQVPETSPRQAGPIAAPENTRPQISLSASEIYRKAARSVVVVMAYLTGAGRVSQGSGVVIGADTVATNCHVIENATDAAILYQGQQYVVVATRGNRESDACVVTTQGLPAPAAVTAALSTVEPGQRVYSIGSPRGLELTIAEGLVSSLRKNEKQLPSIQTSAPISPGSSGGGLFDEYGRVIGITTMTLRDSQNLNFAIPIELLLRR